MLLTEFDPSSRAVIDPEMCVHPVEGLPEIAVSCFSHHLFEAVLAFFQPERICGVGGANGKAPVYAVDYRGRRIAFYESRVGEPACIGDFEDLIAMGLKKLILFGNCGVLDRSIEDCGIIIPTRAIRDEGSSYHYAAAADFIDVNRKYRDVFHQVLADCGCPYVEGTTWTTDAPYRETAEKGPGAGKPRGQSAWRWNAPECRLWPTSGAWISSSSSMPGTIWTTPNGSPGACPATSAWTIRARLLCWPLSWQRCYKKGSNGTNQMLI